MSNNDTTNTWKRNGTIAQVLIKWTIVVFGAAAAFYTLTNKVDQQAAGLSAAERQIDKMQEASEQSRKENDAFQRQILTTLARIEVQIQQLQKDRP